MPSIKESPASSVKEALERKLHRTRPTTAMSQYRRAQPILRAAGWYDKPVLLRFPINLADDEVDDWLEDFIGPHEGGPWLDYFFRSTNPGTPAFRKPVYGFAFEREGDAMMFRLRFSEQVAPFAALWDA